MMLNKDTINKSDNKLIRKNFFKSLLNIKNVNKNKKIIDFKKFDLSPVIKIIAIVSNKKILLNNLFF